VQIKQVLTTTSFILVLKYIKSLVFKEEQEENEPLRGEFMLVGIHALINVHEYHCIAIRMRCWLMDA
jgi:hypothetical protein